MTYVDPPEGWKYGFPKPLPDPPPEDLYRWLIEEGYPAELIAYYGDIFFVRHWEEDV